MKDNFILNYIGQAIKGLEKTPHKHTNMSIAFAKALVKKVKDS